MRGGIWAKDDLNVSETADSTAARNRNGAQQGLWCRLYVSNKISLHYALQRYRTVPVEWGRKNSAQFTRRNTINGKGGTMCLSVKTGHQQAECGQAGYAIVVCYTSHLP